MEYDDYGGDEGEMDMEMQQALQKQQQAQTELFKAFQMARRPPLASLYKNCIKPQLHGDGARQLYEILVLALLLNLINLLKFLPPIIRWLSSTVLGVLFLFRWHGSKSSLFIIAFASFAYLLLIVVEKKVAFGKFLLPTFCVVFSMLLQFSLLDPKNFTEIRGILMVMAMKVLSLDWDMRKIDKKLKKDDSDIGVYNGKNVPSNSLHPLEYLSYVFNVATLPFGPWYSFSAHRSILEKQSFKQSMLSFLIGSLFFVWSFACLFISSCILNWFILDEYEYYSRTIVNYKEAASFRFSHYFVSYFSEATILLSGATMRDVISVGDLPKKNMLQHVTNLWKIEMPRSLTDIVTNWNIPMHNWLKIYVFQPSLKYGSLSAVLLTYVASSALHGFNFQISAVLLSLGFYSYGEYVMRRKLAKSFDACIGAKKCYSCGHKYKSWNFFVMMFNFLFALISIYHLIYLGMLFDSSNSQIEGYGMQHVWNKWSQANFASFYLGLGVFVFGLVI